MKQVASTVVLALITLLATYQIAQAQVNYTLAVSANASFTRLSGASAFTWTTTTANDEEYSAATNIGFNFTYCGTTFTQFQASTNGFIRMGTGLAGATSADALSGTLRSIIAPLWDNLKVTATATDITYLLEGTAGSQTLTVEWQNVYWNNAAPSPNANFQIVLHEGTNKIDFKYGYMGTPATGSASIGLANNVAITTAGSATDEFLSVNVGGSAGARSFHESMGYTFNGINAAPDSGTVLVFTPVTPVPMSGSFGIGAGLDFTTLSSAAMALNINGISGPVVLTIASGTYDDVFHLVDVAGTSSTNTITLRGDGGTVILSPSNGSQSTSGPGASAGDAIIRLDGTDYVTIDGLSLTQNAKNTAAALKFNMGVSVNNSVLNSTPQSGAQFNTFKNLSINLGGGGVTAGLIGIRLGTAGTAPGTYNFALTNSFNTIQDVSISGFHAAAIKFFGHSVTVPDSGNKITGVIGRNTLGPVVGGIGSDTRVIEMDCQSTVTIEKTDIANIANTFNATNNIYGIVTNLAGAAGNLNRGKFIIRNNTISNLSNGGALVTTGFTGGMSLNATNNTTVYEIYNNKIYNLFTNGNGASRVTGILINATTTTNMVASVYNNMISDLRAPQSTSGPSVRGLDMQDAGGTGVFSVYNNTVSLDDAVPPTSANHQSACMYFASFGTGTLDLRNNIFSNTMSVTGTGRAIALYASATTNLVRLSTTSDYNLYYVGTGSATRGVSSDVTNIYQTLAAHQAAVATGGLGGPRDVNAKSLAVTFVSSSDLHLSGGSNGDHNLTGTPLALVATDIDGATRNASAPYIGADEASTALPVELSAFTAASHGSSVVLNWTTATETNNYGFDIEKLSNGSWVKIGFVDGAGTSASPKSYQYVDASCAGRLSYRLKQIDRDGMFTYSSVVEVAATAAPARYELAQNYPNPFNPSTTIRFAVKQAERATLKVYDVTGREVAELFNDAAQPGQFYNVPFNASGLSSGVYFYVLQTQSFREVKRMQLLK
jgi:hypothetical protein